MIDLKGNISSSTTLIKGSVSNNSGIIKGTLSTSSQGTKNYELLINKPSINGVELIGNKTSSEIKVQDEMDFITPQQIDNIIYGG